MNTKPKKSKIRAALRFLFGFGLLYIALGMLAIGGLPAGLIGVGFLIATFKAWKPQMENIKTAWRAAKRKK